MKGKRFSVAVLKQAELGMAVGDIIRQVGISEQTFCRWKKQYAGLHTNEVKELRQLQEENARLKKLVAELSLDKAILRIVWLCSAPRRPAFWSITAVSFPGCCSISGPITDKQRSISAVPASRPTTTSSRLSTARSATSA